MSKKIYLSPSDHGQGANTCLHNGCYEDKHTRPIAQVCARYLKAHGVEVMIGQENMRLSERCEQSDNFGADLHVPIHTNAWDADTRYLMFMFYADQERYRKLFDAVRKPVEEVYPDKKESVFRVRTDLYEIYMPDAMTIYCELGFHTNQKDCDEFIHNPELVGKALAKGLLDYLGIAWQEEEKTIYRVQVGAFTDKKYAERLLDDLKNAGFQGFIVG